MDWPISQQEINQLCLLMCQIIINKYGNWQNYPIEELSLKVGYFELEKINNLIKNIIFSDNSNISVLEEQLKSDLSNR